MKALSLFVMATSLATGLWMAGGTEAAAEVDYPWCIITGGNSEGVYSCGYVSFEQCQQTRIGTDMCVANPRYQPGRAAPDTPSSAPKQSQPARP